MKKVHNINNNEALDFIVQLAALLKSKVSHEVQILKSLHNIIPSFEDEESGWSRFSSLSLNNNLSGNYVSSLGICSSETFDSTLKWAKAKFGRRCKCIIDNLVTLGEICSSFVVRNAREVALGKDGEDLISLGVFAPDEYTAFALGQKNTTLQHILGMKQRRLGDYIQLSVKIGLISCVSESYIPGHTCKHYKLNHDRLNQLKHVQSILTTSSYPTHTPGSSIISDDGSLGICSSETFDSTLKQDEDSGWSRFSSSLNNNNLSGITISSLGICSSETFDAKLSSSINFRKIGKVSNEQVMAALKNHYPWWDKYIVEDAGYKFTPTIHRSSGGNVTKIGLRETCKIANTRRDIRKEMLEQCWGEFDEEKQCYDVKSSIYRINYFLNTGKWLENKIDFYALMCPFKFRNEVDREAYKSIAMRLYFDNSSKSVVNHIRVKIKKLYSEKQITYDEYCETMNKCEEILPVMFDSMRAVIGDVYDNEIFMYESIIYREVRHKLIAQGHDIKQCYDCFYSDRDISGIENLIKETAMEVMKDIKGYSNKTETSELESVEEQNGSGCRQNGSQAVAGSTQLKTIPDASGRNHECIQEIDTYSFTLPPVKEVNYADNPLGDIEELLDCVLGITKQNEQKEYFL